MTRATYTIRGSGWTGTLTSRLGLAIDLARAKSSGDVMIDKLRGGQTQYCVARITAGCGTVSSEGAALREEKMIVKAARAAGTEYAF